jgi:hypothetical protein
VIGEEGHTSGGGPGRCTGEAGVIEAAQDATRAAGSARGAIGVIEVPRGRRNHQCDPTCQCGSRGSHAWCGELGTSSSVAARGTVGPARRGVPMGGTIGVSSESKKNPNRQLDGAKGKTASSKTMCREITRQLVDRSRQR